MKLARPGRILVLLIGGGAGLWSSSPARAQSGEEELATVSKLLKIGDQPVSIGGGLRYWATGPESGPHGWGYRLIVTFLFPK